MRPRLPTGNLFITRTLFRGEVPELAEGARLEIVCTANPGTVGSNPTLSAMGSHESSCFFSKFMDTNFGNGLPGEPGGKNAANPVRPEREQR